MPDPLPESIHYTSIPGSIGRSLGFAEAELGEFDEEYILEEIERELRSIGVQPIRLGWGGALVRQLVEAPPPLLWNLNSGVLGGVRTAQVACLCEMLGISLVGPGAWTAGLVQDKTATYAFLAATDIEVASPAGLLLAGLDDVELLARLPSSGACVIKPNNDESSRGLIFVPEGSAHERLVDLAANAILDWGAVRLEAYIPGHDISANAAVDETGNLMPLEPLLIEHGLPIYDGDAKARMSHRTRPLRELNSGAADRIRAQVAQLCTALRFQHYARFDFRWNPADGSIVFLEANYCPSFDIADDFAASARASGVDYRKMLTHILGAAERDRAKYRWFNELPNSVRRAWKPTDLAEFVRAS